MERPLVLSVVLAALPAPPTADRVVVAPADPEFGAEELRLPAPEGRPTLP
jgi:hypothetical protein